MGLPVSYIVAFGFQRRIPLEYAIHSELINVSDLGCITTMVLAILLNELPAAAEGHSESRQAGGKQKDVPNKGDATATIGAGSGLERSQTDPPWEVKDSTSSGLSWVKKSEALPWEAKDRRSSRLNWVKMSETLPWEEKDKRSSSRNEAKKGHASKSAAKRVEQQIQTRNFAMQSSLLSIQIKESDQEVERQHADTNGGCCGSEILPVGHKDLLNSGYSYIDVVTFIILTINNLGCFFLAIVLSSKLRSDNWEFFSNWHVLMVTMVSEDLLLRIGTIIIVEAIIFLPKPWNTSKHMANTEENLVEVDFQVVQDDQLSFEHHEGSCCISGLAQLSNAYYKGVRPGMTVVSINKQNLVYGTEAMGFISRSFSKRGYAWITVLMPHSELEQVSIEVPTKIKLAFNQQLRVFRDPDKGSALYSSGVRKNWRLIRAGKFLVNTVSEYESAMHTLRHTKHEVTLVFRPYGGRCEIPYFNEDVRVTDIVTVTSDNKVRDSLGAVRGSTESSLRRSTGSSLRKSTDSSVGRSTLQTPILVNNKSGIRTMQSIAEDNEDGDFFEAGDEEIGMSVDVMKRSAEEQDRNEGIQMTHLGSTDRKEVSPPKNKARGRRHGRKLDSRRKDGTSKSPTRNSPGRNGKRRKEAKHLRTNQKPTPTRYTAANYSFFTKPGIRSMSRHVKQRLAPSNTNIDLAPASLSPSATTSNDRKDKNGGSSAVSNGNTALPVNGIAL
mmetsp:Transcript_12925/g.21529  ORF Transcript_12925/g.21529 Transcript_12925/m.21529 type:complete len:723 (-) Transcript_12925:153-2321(-)